MKYLFYLSVLVFTFLSCEPDLKHAQVISGDWRGIKWTKNGQKAEKSARGLIMRFDGTSLFAGQLGEGPMKGNYRLDGDNLYLTERGGTEHKYEFEKLTPDSMYLNVTHRGSDELMIFTRKYKKNLLIDEKTKQEIIDQNRDAINRNKKE